MIICLLDVPMRGIFLSLINCFFRLIKFILTAARIFFKAGAKKYTDDELKKILEDDNTPVFAADDGSGNILGYVFCIFETAHSGAMCDVKTLYIDDLCVDENCRGQKIARNSTNLFLILQKNQAVTT